MNKIIIIIGVLALTAVSGFLGYQVYQDQKVQESKEETAKVAKKEIDPLTLSPIVSSLSNSQDSSLSAQEESADSIPLLESPTNSFSSSNIVNDPITQTPQEIDNGTSQFSQASDEQISFRDEFTLNGAWSSRNGYDVSGSAIVIQGNDISAVKLAEDFTFQNAPDPVVYLSSSTNPTNLEGSILIGELKSNNGASAWEVDPDDVESFSGSVIIWCKAFNVMMAVAPLS